MRTNRVKPLHSAMVPVKFRAVMKRCSSLTTTASRMTLALGLCIAVCAVTIACSSTPKTQDTAKKALRDTDEQIFLGDTIKKNYDPNVIMKRGEEIGRASCRERV